MIGKLLRLAGFLIVYACVATVISLAVLAAWFAHAWKLDRGRLIQALAVAQGIDVQALKEQTGAQREEPSREEPSYEQILEARAVKNRNLELREQSLQNDSRQLRSELDKFAEEKNRYLQARDAFQKSLLAVQKGAAASGLEDVRTTLETVKPKQAKELLAQMLERKDLDEAVVLLAGMSEGKRAKIFAEFKTPAEMEQLGEVLRRIGQGIPTTTIAESAQKQLPPTKRPEL
ncbi:MAG: hypothetical protein ABSG68_11055 [Thermoguttaceae bacterium]|jgi:flagellar motility protein MotE (MotC chaperone)